jgi:hypothetical protein
MRADEALMCPIGAPASLAATRPAVRTGDEGRRLPESRRLVQWTETRVGVLSKNPIDGVTECLFFMEGWISDLTAAGSQ